MCRLVNKYFNTFTIIKFRKKNNHLLEIFALGSSSVCWLFYVSPNFTFEIGELGKSFVILIHLVINLVVCRCNHILRIQSNTQFSENIWITIQGFKNDIYSSFLYLTSVLNKQIFYPCMISVHSTNIDTN